VAGLAGRLDRALILGMDPPWGPHPAVRVVRPSGFVLGREGAPASEPDIPAIVTEYFRRGSSSAAASPKGPAAIRVHLSISKQALLFPRSEEHTSELQSPD